MDSETSENTDTISADIIANLFTKLPMPSVTFLSTLEFSVFRFYHGITGGMQKIRLISSLLRFFCRIQYFSIIIYITIFRKTSDVASLTQMDQFFYFCLNFTLYNGKTLADPVYFIVFLTLALFCFGVFCYGVWLAWKQANVGIVAQTFFAFFVIELPEILIVPITSQATNLLEQLFTGGSALYTFHLVVSLVAAVCLLVVNYFTVNTVRSSIFCRGGQWIVYWRPVSVEIMFLVVLVLSNVMQGMVDIRHLVVVNSVMNVFLGLYLLTLGCLQNHLFEVENAYDAARGLTLLVVCVLNFLEEFKVWQIGDWMFYVCGWVVIGMTAIFYGILILVNKRLTRKLKKGKISFDFGERIDNFRLIHLVKLAMIEALDGVQDLNFIDAALAKDRPSWTQYAILQFASLIDTHHPKAHKLLETVGLMTESAVCDRYILYEFDLLEKAGIVGEPPESIVPLVAELESRIGQFQSVIKTFTTKISDNMTVNYLLIDAMCSMKNVLRDRIEHMKKLMPNCPNVLYLYSTYMGKVKENEEESRHWSSVAAEISRGSLVFADYTHMHALDYFPKLQAKVIDKVTQERECQAPGFRYFGLSNFIARMPPMQKTRQDSGQSIAKVFKNRARVIRSASISFFALFMLAVLVHFFVLYKRAIECRDEHVRAIDYEIGWLEITTSFGKFIISCLDVVTRESGVISSEDIDNVLALSNDLHSKRDALFMLTQQNIYDSAIFEQAMSVATSRTVEFASIDADHVIKESMIMYISRFESLVTAIFKGGEFQQSAPELNMLYRTCYSSLAYFMQNYEAILFCMQDYATLLTQYFFGIFWSLIGTGLFFIIVAVLQVFLYREVTTIFDLFPHETSKKTQLILHTFLCQDFHTLTSFLVKFYSSLTLTVVASIGLVFVVYEYAQYNSASFMECATEIANDGYQLVYIFSPLVDMFLLQNNIPEDVRNPEFHRANIEQVVGFYLHGSGYGKLVRFDRVTVSDYQYVQLLLKKIALEETAMFSRAEVNELLAIANGVLYNDIWTRTNASRKAFEDSLLTFVVGVSNIIQGFLWISILCCAVAIYCVHKVRENMNMLIQLLTQIPESHISASEKLADILQNKPQAAQLSEIKHSSVLDMVMKPCALIDTNDHIISTNRIWLNYYSENPEYMIGRSVIEFLRGTDLKHTTIPVDEEQRLVVIEELRAEDDCRKKLRTMEEKLRSLRSVIIPRRFVDFQDTADVEVGFIVNCTIVMSPSKADDLNPDEWITDVREFDNWIMERCKICEDVDILRETGRDTVLLFGVNGIYNRELLVQMAICIAFDIIRWDVEYEWRAEGIDISVCISSGEGTVLSFDKKRSGIMEMNGPVIERQIALRERLEIGAVICCAETYQLLSDMKIGCQFSQIDELAYIFTVDYEIDPMPVTQTSTYSYS